MAVFTFYDSNLSCNIANQGGCSWAKKVRVYRTDDSIVRKFSFVFRSELIEKVLNLLGQISIAGFVPPFSHHYCEALASKIPTQHLLQLGTQTLTTLSRKDDIQAVLISCVIFIGSRTQHQLSWLLITFHLCTWASRVGNVESSRIQYPADDVCSSFMGWWFTSYIIFGGMG